MNEYRVYRNAQLDIQEKTIQCDNHTIQISNISRIWIGGRSHKIMSMNRFIVLLCVIYLGFHVMDRVLITFAAAYLALALLRFFTCSVVYRGLHVELSSGVVYSFLFRGKNFLSDVHSILTNLLADMSAAEFYTINFVGKGSIINKSDGGDSAVFATKIPDKSDAPLNPLGGDLEKLYNAYRILDEKDDEALEVIQKAIIQNQKSDYEGLKESFALFMSKGLIINCNDLGLHFLIEQLRKALF